MPEDELQAAIGRAEEKRRELQEQVSAYLPAKAVVFMSRAAERYRRQVTLGLDGNPQAALKARLLTRMVRRKNPAGAIPGWWSPSAQS